MGGVPVTDKWTLGASVVKERLVRLRGISKSGGSSKRSDRIDATIWCENEEKQKNSPHVCRAICSYAGPGAGGMLAPSP